MRFCCDLGVLPLTVFFATFLVTLLAEVGDKTQFLVMAFAVRYLWGQVFAGMTLGIITGRLLHRRLPADRLRLVSAGCFFLFGIIGLVHAFLV